MDLNDLRALRDLDRATADGYRDGGDATPHASLRDRVLHTFAAVSDDRLGALASAASAMTEDQLAALPPAVLLLFLVDADARASAFVLPEGELGDEDRALLDAACGFADTGDVNDDPARWIPLMKLVVAIDADDADDERVEELYEQTEDAFGDDAISLEELGEWAGRWSGYRATDLDRRLVRVVVAHQLM